MNPTIVFPPLSEIQAANSIQLKSFSGDEWYSISLDNRSCTCAAFVATCVPCKHLNALGVYSVLRPFFGRTHPTFSQALSGMVKSIRLRRVEDAVYWLVYLDTFKETQSRFRTARRILIGSSEDGHSISVMEQVVGSFKRISRVQADLEELTTEVVRICKVPNWWHPSSGGHDYIYHGLVGERQLSQLKTDGKPETFMSLMGQAIAEQDRAKALAGVLGFGQCRLGGTKQATLLLECAKKVDHREAMRLAMVHLSARGALASDNNFIGQAAWMLAGGMSSVADVIEPVNLAEVVELLEGARERWKDPKPIPGWCCDGVHSAGNDVRFMGAWHHMYAVCKAFQHYGRVDPADEWLPEFQCYDGLVIERPEERNCNQLHERRQDG